MAASVNTLKVLIHTPVNTYSLMWAWQNSKSLKEILNLQVFEARSFIKTKKTWESFKIQLRNFSFNSRFRTCKLLYLHIKYKDYEDIKAHKESFNLISRIQRKYTLN